MRLRPTGQTLPPPPCVPLSRYYWGWGASPSPREVSAGRLRPTPQILTHRRAGALAARLRVSAARPHRPAPSVHRGEHSGGSRRDALGWRRSLTSLGRPAGQGRSQEPAPPAAPPVGRGLRCRPPGGSRRGGEPPEGPRRPRPQVRRGPKCDRVQPRSSGGTCGKLCGRQPGTGAPGGAEIHVENKKNSYFQSPHCTGRTAFCPPTPKPGLEGAKGCPLELTGGGGREEVGRRAKCTATPAPAACRVFQSRMGRGRLLPGLWSRLRTDRTTHPNLSDGAGEAIKGLLLAALGWDRRVRDPHCRCTRSAQGPGPALSGMLRGGGLLNPHRLFKRVFPPCGR